MASSVPPPAPLPTPRGMPAAPPMAPGADAMALPADGGVQLSVLQQPFMQNVMPFITSLLLHAGVILVLVGIAKAAKPVLQEMGILEANEQPQIIVNTLDVTLSDTPGGSPHPSPEMGDPLLEYGRDDKMVKNADGFNRTDNLSDNPANGVGGDSTDNGVNPLAIGGRSGAGGTGGAPGGTGDSGGHSAPFGNPGGGTGPGPRCNFVGSGGNARKIAYVCDASGSMVPQLDDLRMEIKKSMYQLKPIQSFNIIFFQTDAAFALDKNDLISATTENKAKAVEYLQKVVAQGKTNPIPALEIAFKGKPDLLFLLTDGEFPDNKLVTDWIKAHNADKKIHINTLALGGGGEKVLREIADDNGGKFKVISELGTEEN